MTKYELLKTLHVLGAVIWVGGAATTQILAIRMQREGNAVRMAAFAKDIEFIGMRVYLPTSLLVLGAGIWMVLDVWEFSDLWIVLGLAGIGYSIINGAFFLGPESGRYGKLVEERGIEDPGAQEKLNRLFLLSRIELIILLLVVADMVIKPGA